MKYKIITHHHPMSNIASVDCLGPLADALTENTSLLSLHLSHNNFSGNGRIYEYNKSSKSAGEIAVRVTLESGMSLDFIVFFFSIWCV